MKQTWQTELQALKNGALERADWRKLKVWLQLDTAVLPETERAKLSAAGLMDPRALLTRSRESGRKSSPWPHRG